MKGFIPVLLIAVSAALSAEVIREEVISINAEEGIPVIIENINGDITVTGENTGSVELTYMVTAETEEAMDALEILLDTTEGLSCTVDYSNQVEDGECCTVDFTVSVPSNIMLDYYLENINGDISVSEASGEGLVSLVNGDISVMSFSGPLELELVNGDVSLEGSPETGSIETVNGSIYLEVDELATDLDVETVNGTVELKLQTDASVAIETLSGDIELDGFSAEITEGVIGQFTEFGNGMLLSISTVNGTVKVTD